MIEDSPKVRLELDSRPESPTLVRAMLAGVAEPLAFDSELLDDLKTAVSEACNNVVLHAYPNGPGPLSVGLEIKPNAVEAMVRDRGGGIRQVASSEDRMGVGLAVISALADRAEFLSVPDGGTEVRMVFSHPAGVEPLEYPGDTDGGEAVRVHLSGDAVVTLAPPALLAGVLGRLARAIAAGARFSLDRFSDVYLVTDAIAGHAGSAASTPWISFAIVAADRRLELTVGPFRPGSGARLQADAASGRPGSPLGLLADELTVELVGGAEMLHIVLVDHRASVLYTRHRAAPQLRQLVAESKARGVLEPERLRRPPADAIDGCGLWLINQLSDLG